MIEKESNYRAIRFRVLKKGEGYRVHKKSINTFWKGGRGLMQADKDRHVTRNYEEVARKIRIEGRIP